MPFNIFGVLEEIKNEYDVNTEERKALSIIENRLYENEKLKQQLEIAVNALHKYSAYELAAISLKQIEELDK